MPYHKYLMLSTVLATSTFFAGTASAEEAQRPVSGEVVFEVQSEHGYHSDDPNNERTNTFGRVEVAPTIQMGEHFYVDGVLVGEPVQDGVPGDDRFFDDEGLFFEELKLNAEFGAWHVYAGKFNPAFGKAWDYGRGIWGEDFAEDYEITEKMGVGGHYTVDTGNGTTHTLGASSFFADTTFLTRSTVTGRGHVEESDGGASNTQDFSSFALSVDGNNIFGVKDLSYHIAYRHLGEGDANPAEKDESGVAVNTNYVFDINPNLQMDALLEYANIDNFGGAWDDYEYLTGSLITRFYQNWNVTIGYTARNIDLAGTGTDINDHLMQISGGYDFLNGLTLEAGWRDSEESEVDNNIFGGLARYTVEF
jgi:hypothetical protein